MTYKWEDSECELLRELMDATALHEAISSAPNNTKGLGLQKQLRDLASPELVRAALIQRDLRIKAAVKFSRGSRMWLSRVGLEQATTELVAEYKAKRFAQTVGADDRIMDWCCGIGGDAIALALHSNASGVVAVDRRPINALRTEMNAGVYDVQDRVEIICTDVTRLEADDAFIHVDPDRRAGRSGKRSLRIEDMSPSAEFLRRVISQARGGAIKLSPASNFPDQFPDTEAELISLNGECREATIWFGELAGDVQYSATVLPANETIRGNPLDAWTDVGELGGFVYDPDPSVVRSGLVDVLCERDGFRRLDDAEEYLTSDEPIKSNFARGFKVLAELSNNDKDLRRYFRAHEYGQVEIKCRHVPTQADALRKKLSLKGKGTATVIVARLSGRTRVLVCERLDFS